MHRPGRLHFLLGARFRHSARRFCANRESGALKIQKDANLCGVDDGTNVSALVKRVADAKLGHAGLDFLDECIVNALVNEDARAGTAHLTLIEPNCID